MHTHLFTGTLIFVVCTNAGESSTSSISGGKNIRFTSRLDAHYLPTKQLHLVQVPSLLQETELSPPPLFDVWPDASLRPLKGEAPEPAVSCHRKEPCFSKLSFFMDPQSCQPRTPPPRCLDCESLKAVLSLTGLRTQMGPLGVFVGLF